jgi:4-hydroxy-tetrahydrodipicolinate synthase
MNNGKIDWEGSFVAAVTPFARTGELDTRAFCENVARLVAEGADGVVVSGCTGESWALTADERVRLFKLAVDTVGSRVPVIAGTGGILTHAVIELSQRARDVGAAGIMVLPPYYCMAGRRDIVAHYAAISDAVRHPILLYNVPRRTGFNLTPDVLEEMIGIEWVVAIKESSADFIQFEATIDRVGRHIEVFTGRSAERGVPAVLMGAKGWVSSLESQVMGQEAIEMYDLVKSGNVERARDIQLRTLALDQAVHNIGTFPANLKAAMNLVGRGGGYPRLPILPLTSGEIDRVRGVLEAFKLDIVAA